MHSRFRAVSDAKNKPLDELLSGFSLGPSWAKGPQDGKSKSGAGRLMGRKPEENREHTERRDGRGPREEGSRFGGRNRRDESPPLPPREEVRPAPGVTVTIVPAPEAVHLIGKEILHEARVYPLFDVAQTLLAERGRCRAVFESQEPHPFLWRGLLDESVFLTKEDAARHLWTSALRTRFLEEETIDTEPPKGNYTTVARCGLSGEWLGPPNFHAYQTNLRRVHRERYPNLPFESYTAKVRMEKGEEAVNEWLATMTKKTRWRIHGAGDEAWIEDEAMAKREVTLRFLDEAFEEARCVEVNAAIPPAHVSPSLMLSMKQAGNHAKEHPAFLIPSVCKALESEHFPVFKRKGKLFTGPARPQPLPPGQLLAERPNTIVEWIRGNEPAKLEGLWLAVSPEGSTAPPAEYAADLYWLLQQGHILLYLDDTLVVQEIRQPTPPPAADGAVVGKKKKKRKKKPGGKAAAGITGEADAEESSADDSDEDQVAATEETTPASSEPAEQPDPETDTQPDTAPDESILEKPVQPEPREEPHQTAAECLDPITQPDTLIEAQADIEPSAPAEVTPGEPGQPAAPEEIPPSASPGVDESPTV
jgi:hypothetical protein